MLVTGESGTGKELVAAAVHAASRRVNRAFVTVNCAAIPRDLVESEMFGHERGAFTGATERRLGRFELAHEGTLFLDEIGDLSAEAQAKLLRTLETGELQRIGAETSLRTDVRVVSATNRRLEDEVVGGQLPGGSLLPAERLSDLAAAAAGAAGGPPGPGRPPGGAGAPPAGGDVHPGGVRRAERLLVARQRARAGEPGRAAQHPLRPDRGRRRGARGAPRRTLRPGAVRRAGSARCPRRWTTSSGA